MPPQGSRPDDPDTSLEPASRGSPFLAAASVDQATHVWLLAWEICWGGRYRSVQAE